MIADLTPTTDVPEDWVRQTRLVLWEGGGAEVELEGSSFTSTSPDGLSVEHQRELLAELRRALREGGLRGPDGRELVRRFREMRAEAQRSSFGITIPNLGLPRGHAVGAGRDLHGGDRRGALDGRRHHALDRRAVTRSRVTEILST